MSVAKLFGRSRRSASRYRLSDKAAAALHLLMKQYKWLLYKILLTKSRVPKVWETINELQTLFMMGLSMLFFNNGMFKPDINEPATPTPTIEPVSYAGYGRWLNPRCGSYGSTLLYAPDTTVTRAAIAATVAFLGANALSCMWRYNGICDVRGITTALRE